MPVDGPLKQVFEEAIKEVKDWPAWMRSREVEGSASRTYTHEEVTGTANIDQQEPKNGDKR